MKILRITLLAGVLASALGGCIVRPAPVRTTVVRAPCHTECWWSHGHRVCERRCR
jgi:hypothetical protein